MTDIAAIAKGLTKAQREALAAPEWSMMAQYNAGIAEPLRFGLLVQDGCGHKLSALGLSVRQHLQEQER